MGSKTSIMVLVTQLLLSCFNQTRYGFFHHLFRSYKKSATLVQFCWNCFQNAFRSISCQSTSLFCDECQGITLIQQTQFPFWALVGTWININSAFDQTSVKISNQRPDITTRIRFSISLHFLTKTNVILYALLAFMNISFVHRINTTCFWHFHVGMRQTKLSNRRIQCKPVYTMSSCINQHG